MNEFDNNQIEVKPVAVAFFAKQHSRRFQFRF